MGRGNARRSIHTSVDVAPGGIEEGVNVVVAVGVRSLFVKAFERPNLALLQDVDEFILHHVVRVDDKGEEL